MNLTQMSVLPACIQTGDSKELERDWLEYLVILSMTIFLQTLEKGKSVCLYFYIYVIDLFHSELFACVLMLAFCQMNIGRC